jgi:hypothetical protein
MTVNVVTMIGYGDEEQRSDGSTITPTYLEASVETADTSYVVTSTACRDEVEAQEVVDAYNNAPHGSISLDEAKNTVRQ